MKTLKKLLCAALSLVTLLALLAGCASGTIKSTKEEAAVVGKCGGYDVRYEELRHLAYMHRGEMEAEYGEGIFAGTDAENYKNELWARVEGSLCASYAILDICEKAGVKRSDKLTKNEVNDEVEAVIAGLGGLEGYREYLAETKMTDAVYRLYTAILSCQYRYYDEVAFDALEKEAYDLIQAHEGFVRTMSIFVKNDEGEVVATNRAKAEHVRDEVRGGKSLESFIGTSYNQDMSNCEYYFPRGYMEEAYENAAFVLEVGEVSDVVETDEGFYIIQRLEPDEAYFELHIEELVNKYIVGKMNIAFAEHAKELSFELSDYGKSLDILEIQ